MMSLQCFSTLSPNVAYSHQYFATLTFEETLNLKIPYSLPKGSVLAWNFNTTIHNTPQALTIQLLDLIPHYDDIRNIIELMPQAYADLAHSVNLILSIPGIKCPLEVTYHFSKVCCLFLTFFD